MEHLKRSRNIIPYSYRPKSGSDGKSRDKRGRQEGAREDDRRFVDVMLDLQGYDAPLSPIPDISVIDASGRERRASFRHQKLEPVKVGSVVVVREARSGAGVAAYVVGHEIHQARRWGGGVSYEERRGALDVSGCLLGTLSLGFI